MAFSRPIRNCCLKFREIVGNRFLESVAPYSSIKTEVERVSKIISSHPFPDQSLFPVLQSHIPSSHLSTVFVESVLGRLFATHSNGLKALEFFRFSLNHPDYVPSSDAFEKTLHILARMGYFEKAWELMHEISKSHRSLLTTKSMNTLLARIAKYGSYEDAVTAFERMEKEIFNISFGTDEFNTLLVAFCTQRTMRDAQTLFEQMCNRFSPNTKTWNILLLGFKEKGDITSMEIFFHDLRRRGFQPNRVTFSIRIDAYCKKGYIADAQRILAEMEDAKYPPSLDLLTTLVHGAGIAKNASKAWEFFEEIGKRRMEPDIAAYNALISSLAQCGEMNGIVDLMAIIDEKGMPFDDVTYRTVFSVLMKTCDIESVVDLYRMMISRDFVPEERTVVMLVKFMCLNGLLEEGMELWKHILAKGYCPHPNALHILVTALCSRSRVDEALECCKQLLETRKSPKKETFFMLERFCLKNRQMKRLKEIDQLLSRQQRHLPPRTCPQQLVLET